MNASRSRSRASNQHVLPVALRCSCKPAQIASRSRSRSREQPARAPRCARARASNQHVTPVALRFSCKPDEQIARAERSRSREEHVTVHDHRETNTYPAQSCEHACAGGEFSTVAPHTRCRTAPHCDRRCSLLRASSLKQREELLREPSSCTPRHHDRFAKIKFQRY